jgi:hypothetical protein
LRDCGCAAVMIECRACGSAHLVPFRCGARTCPSCSRRAAAAVTDRVAARVAVHDLAMEAEPWDGAGAAQRRSWRLVTLTSRAPARDQRFSVRALARNVRGVRRAFGHWWRLTPWGRQLRSDGSRRKRSRRDTSYVLALEVAPGGMVHVHALIYGEYVAQRSLAAAWSAVLGERAILDVRTVRGAGVAGALREVLKYASKGEKGHRQVEHAAAVELALRGVRRVELGGALRWVQLSDSSGDSEDVREADLHDSHVAACQVCGVIGEWRWVAIVSAASVEENGGFGTWRGRADIRSAPSWPPRSACLSPPSACRE